MRTCAGSFEKVRGALASAAHAFNGRYLASESSSSGRLDLGFELFGADPDRDRAVGAADGGRESCTFLPDVSVMVTASGVAASTAPTVSPPTPFTVAPAATEASAAARPFSISALSCAWVIPNRSLPSRRGEAVLRQKSLVLVGFQEDILALDRLDRANGGARRVDDRHSDGDRRRRLRGGRSGGPRRPDPEH